MLQIGLHVYSDHDNTADPLTSWLELTITYILISVKLLLSFLRDKEDRT